MLLHNFTELNIQVAHAMAETLLTLLLIWWNTMTKNSLEMKRFIWLLPLHPCPALKEVGTGTHTGQEAGGRNWCRSHEGVLLIGLLIMVCSSYFLLETRTISSVTTPSTADWALPHWSLIKKMPHSCILWWDFLCWKENHLLSDGSSLHPADIKANQHTQ